jgi:hypothetical protein
MKNPSMFVRIMSGVLAAVMIVGAVTAVLVYLV